jgi:hypothetical protein
LAPAIASNLESILKQDDDEYNNNNNNKDINNNIAPFPWYRTLLKALLG